ncbi:HlyD family secretion protein [Clostridium ganghwense]|uniref:Efflux RND transporter periplasmic adaptor subunit n=1 Tax=Clostridium ganghwense TaxID=312089 RepID=A0ABT4CMK0_9CLOT|nr:efflux RND transporter periplasmic adaptor subunit [Clostridium ganghwense]MCY6369316.1 efflux RND transporter periplasmic adaptor subunit [Clostridium ganghwense]
MKQNKSTFKYLTASVCISFFSAFFLLGCSNTKQKPNVYSGTAECTEYDVQTELGGSISEIFASEGGKINKGDVIAKLDDEVLKLNLKQAQAAYEISKQKYNETKSGTREEQIRQAKSNLSASKAKLDELLSGSRPEEIKQAEIALKQSQSLLEQAQKNYNYRKNNLEKYKTLQNEGIISHEQLDQAQNVFDVAEGQLISSQNSVKTSQEKLTLIKNGATTQTIEAAKASVENAKAQYDLLINGSSSYVLNSLKSALGQAEASKKIAKYNLSQTTIKSPITGTVLKTWVKKGETAAPGSIIATVSDLNDLWVKVYVQEKYYSKLSLNQEVKIICDALNEPVNGKITYISSNAEFTPKNTQTKEDKQKRVFEVKVKILDHLDIIKPGMDLEVILWNVQ